MLDRVTGWVEADEDVRAAILVGSHAGKEETDEFSDYDVALFVTDQDRYASDDSWLSDIEYGFRGRERISCALPLDDLRAGNASRFLDPLDRHA